MLEIKRCNYITGDALSVSYGLSKVISFVETEGRTPIFLSKPRSSNSKKTSLQYMVSCSKLDFNNSHDFISILSDKSKLFRVDLIIVDMWHLNLPSVLEYKKHLDNTGIDYIIVSSKYHYKNSDDIRIYEMRSESIESSVSGNFWDFRTVYHVKDKVSGWESTLDDLTKSYIRDKRIDGIIGEEE